MSKLILCAPGHTALVDDADFYALSEFKWRAVPCGTKKDHSRPARTERVDGKVRTIFLYRQLLDAPAGLCVDHINGDVWDNRRCNLRLCTRGENVRNQAGHRDRKSPYKGITKKRQRWFAHVAVNGRSYWTSGYATPEEAARAYDKIALEHHGEFARLNFPQDQAA